MKKISMIIAVITAVVICFSYTVNAQVAINTDGSSPNASAMLDVKSSNKGILPPRVANTGVVSSPEAGLIVFDISNNCLRTYNGTEWSDCMDGTPFSCGNTFVDMRDGKIYTTVQIGSQCWMAENLNIGYMIMGVDDQLNNGAIEKYCYDNNTNNCDTYGGLYKWDEMMQYVTTEGTKGICPDAWYLPTDAEWCILENEVDAGTILCTTTGNRGIDAGGNLKENSTVHWNTPNTGGTNNSGFTSLPGGYQSPDGSFRNLLNTASFWSSSESGAYAWYRMLEYNNEYVYRQNNALQTYSFSVRCVKD